MVRRLWSKSVILLTVSCLFGAMASAQVAEFNATSAALREARASGNHAAYLASVRKLLAFAPGHPSIHVHLARALALGGDSAGALAQLNRLADFGFSFQTAGDASFQSLKDHPGFIAVAQRIAANGRGSGRAKDLIKLGISGGSEGVAWSESSRSFLMGSSGSIYSYRLDGEAPARRVANAFAPQVLGIRPDPATRSYLVCVNQPDGSNSAVVRHHQINGAIMAIHRLPAKNALCNDIALLKDGSFAVTDTNNGAVFHLVGDRLEPLALTMPTYQPNGIAYDRENDRIYVAHAGGVIAHDRAAGKSRHLSINDTLLGSIDGMVWHKGSLIGLQGLTHLGLGSRLLRIVPDDGARAGRVDILLAAADFPGRASTVAVAGNEAFVIGGSRQANGNDEEPVLIRTPL